MQREPFRTVVYLGEVLGPASLGVLCSILGEHSVSDRKSLSFTPQACFITTPGTIPDPGMWWAR